MSFAVSRCFCATLSHCVFHVVFKRSNGVSSHGMCSNDFRIAPKHAFIGQPNEFDPVSPIPDVAFEHPHMWGQEKRMKKPTLSRPSQIWGNDSTQSSHVPKEVYSLFPDMLHSFSPSFIVSARRACFPVAPANALLGESMQISLNSLTKSAPVSW